MSKGKNLAEQQYWILLGWSQGTPSNGTGRTISHSTDGGVRSGSADAVIVYLRRYRPQEAAIRYSKWIPDTHKMRRYAFSETNVLITLICGRQKCWEGVEKCGNSCTCVKNDQFCRKSQNLAISSIKQYLQCLIVVPAW